MITLQKAKQILMYRNISLSSDSKELQEKRSKFLDKLNMINWNGNFEVFEMYQVEDNDPFKSKPEKYQFFKKEFNTRTKLNSETCLESDKLSHDKIIPLMCEVINSLIRNKYHFAVFYAEGQRSPHIRIYDFEELKELDNPQQRIKEQVNFWRKQTPFGLFNYFDTGMFVDDHPLQLEFAPHWKYKTPFNLLFEYLPEGEKCKQ